MTTFEKMRVVSLQVDNVMRVTAVHIEPDGNMVVIGGDNGAGKSSVLNAMWAALSSQREHGKEIQTPVHLGAESGSVHVDLGQLRVTRTWNAEGNTTKLTVTDAAGRTYQSPAALLDELMGHGFDPLAFMRLPPRDQVAALLEIVDIGIDLDANARERSALHNLRQDKGRDARFGRARVEELPVVDEPDPGWTFDPAELTAELYERQRADAALAEARAAADAQADEKVRAQADVDKLTAALNNAVTARNAATAEGTHRAVAIIEAQTAVDLCRPATDITDDFALLAERSEIVRQHHERETAIADAATLAAEHSELDNQVKALDRARVDAIAAAEMPIAGLSFDEDGLMLNGLPLTQASQAEKTRACVAIAMAGDPVIRVVRVADGSLLDDASMVLLGELAAEYDFQVFVETVGDRNPAAIIIEDGAVRSDGRIGS